MKVRCLYVNTHAGQALREGGVEHLVEKHQPDLVFLVEVGRRAAKERVKKLFPRAEWSITGVLPHEKGLEVESGTIVVAKRVVLRRKWWGNPKIADQRWLGKGRRDKWHPMRRLTQARYVFADKRDLELEVSPVHLWTHAGHPLHGDSDISKGYRSQALKYVEAAGQAAGQNRAVVHLGDTNAMSVDGNWLREMYAKHGMRLLVSHGLDKLFASKRVKVVGDPVIISKAEAHTDHESMFVVLEVR